MNSAFRALIWELLARRGWPLVALLAGSVFLPLSVWLVGPIPDLLGFGFLLLLIPGIAFVGDVSLGSDGPLTARASLFPRRLFRLPVSAWCLGAAPLVLGTLVLGGVVVVLTLALTALRPGVTPSVGVWPGLLVAVGVAWIQALTWSPFPLPWLRVVGVVALFPAVVFLGIGCAHLPARLAEAALLILLGLAYLVAVRGVRLARHGVGVDEPAPAEAAAPRERPAFTSVFNAQLWLEWRQVGRELLLLSVNVLWAVPVMVLLPYALANLEPLPETKAVLETFGVGWLVASVPLLGTLALALVLGPDLGRLRWRRAGFGMASFLASKPVANETLVRVKMVFLAQVIGAASVLAWFLALIWSLATGRVGEMAERVTHWVGPFAAPVPVAGLLGLATLAWLWAAGGLWAGLWGRWWSVLASMVPTVTFVSAFLTRHYWLAALAVVGHAACMTPLLRRVPAAGLVAVVLAVCTLAGWWPVAVLLWPVPGLLVARVALEANRHR